MIVVNSEKLFISNYENKWNLDDFKADYFMVFLICPYSRI